MMGRIENYILYVIAILFISCSNMKQGVGLRGIVVDDERITLDGDTFEIQERIGDSLLIVSKERFTESVPDYLLKIERNGFYYIQAKADDISAIEGTEKFVVLDNGQVYDLINHQVLFRTACDYSEGLSYLGTFDNIYLFANYDSLSFSDGKYLQLQPEVYHRAIAGSNMVKLILGAESIELSTRDLYQCIGKKMENDKSVCHLKKSYFVKPHNEHENDDAGYDVDIEIPIGSDVADAAMRQWILMQIRNDVFCLLDYNPEEIAISKCGNVEEMQHCLDGYGVLWEKLLRNAYEYEDTLRAPQISSHIMVREVVDRKDFVTYYFSSNPYKGGMHELPRSYYVTYDKQRNVFLSASNTIKKEARNKIAIATLRSLKRQHDEIYERESVWEDFTKAIFSLNCPSDEDNHASEFVNSLYSDLYYCDNAAKWTSKRSPYVVSDFPLPHFAIIPEGIVFTYHPYQIDCFASGEYHAVVTWKDAEGCLLYKYGHVNSNKQLSKYINRSCL